MYYHTPKKASKSANTSTRTSTSTSTNRFRNRCSTRTWIKLTSNPGQIVLSSRAKRGTPCKSAPPSASKGVSTPARTFQIVYPLENHVRRIHSTPGRAPGPSPTRPRAIERRFRPARCQRLLLVQEVPSPLRSRSPFRCWRTGLLWLHSRMVAAARRPTRHQRARNPRRQASLLAARFPSRRNLQRCRQAPRNVPCRNFISSPPASNAAEREVQWARNAAAFAKAAAQCGSSSPEKRHRFALLALGSEPLERAKLVVELRTEN